MSARQGHKKSIIVFMTALAALLCFVPATPGFAQDAPYDAPYYSAEQLDHLVSRVALYPDPLLAQVLAAATFPDEVPDAARWADEHRGMNSNQLADRIQDDQLPWDPSVQALLPFPSVLDSMASDMRWTEDLGNAFLANQQEVMYAVQRMRQRARDYGYLRSGREIVVADGPSYITILPARPDYVVVPYYDPVVVYARPRPGFFVGTAIGFRFGVVLGVAYRPWGWGYNRIAWNERVVVINNTPWHRTWVNRTVYVHPYTVRRVVVHDRGWNERHEAMERDRERWAHERHEAVRHEEHREAVRREEHREAERREERHEEHREAVRREERHEEHREAERREHEHDRGNSYNAHERNEERKEEHREAVRDARHDEHHDAHRDAHTDVARVERTDVPHVEHHEDHVHGNNSQGNNSQGNNNHGSNNNRGNGNGNRNSKDHGDHDDKGHNR
jgi:hypothetical protein